MIIAWSLPLFTASIVFIELVFIIAFVIVTNLVSALRQACSLSGIRTLQRVLLRFPLCFFVGFRSGFLGRWEIRFSNRLGRWSVELIWFRRPVAFFLGRRRKSRGWVMITFSSFVVFVETCLMKFFAIWRSPYLSTLEFQCLTSFLS